MANVFPGLAGSAIGVASKTPSSQQQTMLLEQTKTLAESAVQMLYNVQEAGGNPKVCEYNDIIIDLHSIVARQQMLMPK